MTSLGFLGFFLKGVDRKMSHFSTSDDFSMINFHNFIFFYFHFEYLNSDSYPFSFGFPQKYSHDNDIIFDDSPLDASEGQRFLHKRSADDVDSENNDEHWLWSHVDRIKRSINTALGNENDETKSKNRVKRGFWDWGSDLLATEAPSNGPTTTTEAPFSLFNWGLTNNDDKSKTEAPEPEHPAAVMNRPQSDESHNQDDDLDEPIEDDENDIDDGSGYRKIEETRTDYTTTLERYCKFQWVKMILFRVNFVRERRKIASCFGLIHFSWTSLSNLYRLSFCYH